MGKNTRNRGLSKTPTYLTWNSMRRRCFLGSQGKKPAYANVKVCERWEEFSNFLEDMGERPEGTSLDRINVLGDYEPENCRWATPSEQQRNKKFNRTLTYNGVTKSVHDWSEEFGIGSMTLYKRVFEHGWDVEKSLLTPPFGNCKKANKDNGKQKDYKCPCCGLVGNKGNLSQHLRSQKNTCKGEPLNFK